jgi:hypothetical protein
VAAHIVLRSAPFSLRFVHDHEEREDEMKRIAMLVAASALFAGTAWATTNVASTIVSVDPQKHQLVLDDGKTYAVATNVTLEGLRPGDKVAVNAKVQNGTNVIDKIEQTGTPWAGPTGDSVNNNKALQPVPTQP